MVEAVSPEQQIEALRRELAERDAIIAASQAERADAALLKARLTTALLEIERIKLQLAVLRRQRYGQSSERLDHDIAQLEMRLEDLEADCGEQIAATARTADPSRTRSRDASPPAANLCPLISRARWSFMSRRSPASAAAATRPAWPGSARPRPRFWRRSRHAQGDPARPAEICLPAVREGLPGARAGAADREGPARTGAAGPCRRLEILRRDPALPAVGHPCARGRRDRPRDDGASGSGTWPGGCARWPS